MKKEFLTVISNEKIGKDTYKMRLSGASYMVPGQFVEMLIPGYTLRKPFSVNDYEDGILQIAYKIVGCATKHMTTIKKGEVIDTLTCLGTGFDYSNVKKPIIIGGGIGIAPLYYLAKELMKAGHKTKIVLCARTKDEIFFIEEFKKLGEVILATDDGSCGICGNALDAVLDIITEDSFYYSCGPEPMLKAIAKKYRNGEVSLEAIMGCGFGACMGCSIPTRKGSQRVCKEGPVFKSEDVFLD